ncbi:indolethylamine N-methyltransferase-like [Lissotriton helveticus]
MAACFVPKILFEQHFDPDLVADLYGIVESPFAQDTVVQALEELHRTFTTGGVKGDLLIGILSVSMVDHYIAASKVFKEIIATTYSQRCLQDLVKWLKNDLGAHDYSSIFKHACKLEGNSENWIECQETLKRKIKYTVEHDVCKSNPLAPHVFPQADCVVTEYCLEFICLDKETYCNALKNISSLLKIGGHLVMTAAYGCTFHMVGSFKFPAFCLEEGFFRKAISDAGFAIKLLKVKPRIEQSLYSVIDATGVYFLVACKEREVC